MTTDNHAIASLRGRLIDAIYTRYHDPPEEIIDVIMQVVEPWAREQQEQIDRLEREHKAETDCDLDTIRKLLKRAEAAGAEIARLRLELDNARNVKDYTLMDSRLAEKRT